MAGIVNRDITTADFDRVREDLSRGDVGSALAQLISLESASQGNAHDLQITAELLVACGRHEDAARCFEQAVRLRPEDANAHYNLATEYIALGRLDEAETLLQTVIYLNPSDHDAWYNRSTLRTQTPDNNHVEGLRYALQHLAGGDPGEAPLCYALARELEDLGQYEASFDFLQRGAAARRRQLRYDVAGDEAALAEIANTFNAAWLGQGAARKPATRPVFILGLPRSGTTLVERIVASHSAVDSLGEINSLALAVVNTAGPVDGKLELIRASAKVDCAALGARYLGSVDGFGNPARRLIDKTPLNFLYLGLIHRALPGARVLHVRRHPVDSCYAMYKTLFRMGYPFSYSLQDTGRYFAAYDRLMQHWRQTIPGAFLEVDYERLVTDPQDQTRRILNYLELDWEDGCLDFHTLPSATATASAAQVRKPIYQSSVGKWRNYARQLGPFCRQLRRNGVVFTR